MAQAANQLPLWVQFFAAIGTPLVAALVAAVAFMQWRTAHQKVVLDLFDRRMRVQETVRERVRSARGRGRLEIEEIEQLRSAVQDSRFLSGEEVWQDLDKLFDTLNDLSHASEQLTDKSLTQDQRSEYQKEKREAHKSESAYAKGHVELFSPYMKMDAKVVRTPIAHFRDHNKTRLREQD